MYYFSVPFMANIRHDRGEIAQLVEQWPEEPRVLGSSPSLATSICGCSSAVRALPCQGRGPGLESLYPHQELLVLNPKISPIQWAYFGV
jgi:hypothetical protein